MRGPTPPDVPRIVVVYERQPYWEPELRRQFEDDEVVVLACRTVSDLEQTTVQNGDCVVAADLADRPVDVLRWLSRRLINGRSLPVIVITSPGTASLLWHASEMGATAVVSDDCGGQYLARLCRRQWAAAVIDRPAALPSPSAPTRASLQTESKPS